MDRRQKILAAVAAVGIALGGWTPADVRGLPEPCSALAHAMATAPYAIGDDEWYYRMNLFSCGQSSSGQWHYVTHRFDRGCGRLAYRAARSFLASGRAVLSITTADIGPAIDARDHDRDCALYEDGTWG